MATVLIMGASRGIGFEALVQALAAGHIVRALARTARGIPVNHIHLRKIDGDRTGFRSRPARAGRSRCGYPMNRLIYRTGTDPQSSAIILRGDAHSCCGDAGGCDETPDLRHRVRRRKQPRSRGSFVRCGLLPPAWSRVRRQGHTGADRSSKRARMDYRSPGHPHKWTKNSHLPRTD
jgi:hypothetical protein